MFPQFKLHAPFKYQQKERYVSVSLLESTSSLFPESPRDPETPTFQSPDVSVLLIGGVLRTPALQVHQPQRPTRPQDAAQLRPLRRRRCRPGHFGDRRRGHAVLRERLRSRRRVQVQQLQARGKGIYQSFPATVISGFSDTL